MTSTQLRLSGSSLEELTAQVLAEHGPRARIVAAERITVGGIGGFFAKRHYEVTVELSVPGRRGAHARVDPPARAGIAALLDEADELEARIGGADASRHVSTGSVLFAELMDDLTFTVAPEPAVENVPPPANTSPAVTTPPVVLPLASAGDLVALVGLAEDSLPVARQMAIVAGSDDVASDVWIAGLSTVGGFRRVEDRRTALEARANGVERGCTAFLAVGLGLGDGAGLGAGVGAGILGSIRPDQVWVVVDAGRKPEDTARWVHAVAAVVTVDAVAVVRQESTSTPGTVDALGLPIGWLA